ncbi:MAG: hypothetical protein GWP05_10925 [Anaerolineaceae bacterium]|nr:hypothetical protein [Anaerolineaceae bacterium]
MIRPASLLAAMVLSVAAAGCAEPDYTALERYQRGLVLVFHGAGGITTAPAQIRRGLDSGGVDQAIELVDWSAGHNVFEDQSNLARNRRLARDSAMRVARYVGQHPGRPVHLIGLSAGTGLAVFTAEQLPPGVKVDGVCLLASSLNAEYDLTPAMAHVRNEITNFSSVADVAVLGVGVGLSGTVDRGSGVAAGLYGFSLPKDASQRTKALYKKKLIEMPWKAEYIIFGHLGDHLGATSTEFVKRFIAPIILDASRLRQQGKPPAQPAGEQKKEPKDE